MQSGSPGSYTYSVSYTASAWTSYVAYNSSLYPSALAAANDAPVFDVTWGDAARFANWLQNGQPTELGRGGRLDGDGGLHAGRGDIGVCLDGDYPQRRGDLLHPLGERVV